MMMMTTMMDDGDGGDKIDNDVGEDGGRRVTDKIDGTMMMKMM